MSEERKEMKVESFGELKAEDKYFPRFTSKKMGEEHGKATVPESLLAKIVFSKLRPLGLESILSYEARYFPIGVRFLCDDEHKEKKTYDINDQEQLKSFIRENNPEYVEKMLNAFLAILFLKFLDPYRNKDEEKTKEDLVDFIKSKGLQQYLERISISCSVPQIAEYKKDKKCYFSEVIGIDPEKGPKLLDVFIYPALPNLSRNRDDPSCEIEAFLNPVKAKKKKYWTPFLKPKDWDGLKQRYKNIFTLLFSQIPEGESIVVNMPNDFLSGLEPKYKDIALRQYYTAVLEVAEEFPKIKIYLNPCPKNITEFPENVKPVKGSIDTLSIPKKVPEKCHINVAPHPFNPIGNGWENAGNGMDEYSAGIAPTQVLQFYDYFLEYYSIFSKFIKDKSLCKELCVQYVLYKENVKINLKKFKNLYLCYQYMCMFAYSVLELNPEEMYDQIPLPPIMIESYKDVSDYLKQLSSHIGLNKSKYRVEGSTNQIDTLLTVIESFNQNLEGKKDLMEDFPKIEKEEIEIIKRCTGWFLEIQKKLLQQEEDPSLSDEDISSMLETQGSVFGKAFGVTSMLGTPGSLGERASSKNLSGSGTLLDMFTVSDSERDDTESMLLTSRGNKSESSLVAGTPAEDKSMSERVSLHSRVGMNEESVSGRDDDLSEFMLATTDPKKLPPLASTFDTFAPPSSTLPSSVLKFRKRLDDDLSEFMLATTNPEKDLVEFMLATADPKRESKKCELKEEYPRMVSQQLPLTPNASTSLSPSKMSVMFADERGKSADKRGQGSRSEKTLSQLISEVGETESDSRDVLFQTKYGSKKHCGQGSQHE